MSVLAGTAALALLSAALLAALGFADRRPAFESAARGLGALGALALVPRLAEVRDRPAAVLALGLGLWAPHPAPLMLAAAAAAFLALGGSVSEEVSGPALILALAVGAAAVALASEIRGRLVRGGDGAWAGVLGGAAAAAGLLAADHARVLRWGFGIGSGASRLELPGGAVLLGLTLLACLSGTLLLGAHLLTRPDGAAGADAVSRLAGQRLLIVGAGLGIASWGYLLLRGESSSPAAVVSGARDLAGLLGAVGLLVLGVILLLSEGLQGDRASLELRADRAGRAATILALAALVAWGRLGLSTQGTVVTPAVRGLLAAALFGLSATEATAGALFRRTVFLLALLEGLARA